jgi:hypothetical protein
MPAGRRSARDRRLGADYTTSTLMAPVSCPQHFPIASKSFTAWLPESCVQGKAQMRPSQFAWNPIIQTVMKERSTWYRSGEVRDPSWVQSMKSGVQEGRSPGQLRCLGRQVLHCVFKEFWPRISAHRSSRSFCWRSQAGANTCSKPRILVHMLRVEISRHQDEKLPG